MPLSTALSTKQTDLALAILRMTTGTVFAAHGAQKLFVYGATGVTGAFTQMGIPMPGIAGPATGVVELLGGLALIVGLATRIAGFGLSLAMLGAIGFVHLAGGFFAPSGIEFPLALLGATMALTVAGSGRFSLDAVISLRNTQRANPTPSLRPVAAAV